MNTKRKEAFTRLRTILKKCNEIGDILDERYEWRRGKGSEIVFINDYLSNMTLEQLLNINVQEIADQVSANYNSNKID